MKGVENKINKYENVIVCGENRTLSIFSGEIHPPGIIESDRERASIACCNKGIVLLGKWDAGIYHLPIDYLGLFHKLRKTDLSTYNLILNKKWASTSFHKEWISIIVPEVNNKIIYSDLIKVKECTHFKVNGSLDMMHDKHVEKKIISYLKEKVEAVLPKNPAQYKMLLIKRTKKRTMENWVELKSICEKYCKILDLELDIFDDSKDLGTVNQQLNRFRSSKIIIGSGGAGFINLLGCLSDTFFVECKMETRKNDKYNRGDPVCFEILANHLNIDYQKVKVCERNKANLAEVENCLENIKKNDKP